MKYNNRIIFYIIQVFVIIVVLTGCWDNRDVTDINIVTAVALDKTPDGKIKVVVEIPKPSEIVQNQEGGSSEDAAVYYTSTGDTVFEAVRNFLNTIDKKLFWSKLELLVIGKSLAEDGVAEVIDFFERDPEINITAHVVIIKEQASKVPTAFESDLQKIPSIHLVNLLENNQLALGTAYSKRIFDFIRDMSNTGKTSVVPVLKISSPISEDIQMVNLKVEGSAIFKAGKLVGYLTPEQTRGWLLTDDKAGSTIFAIPNPFDETKLISYEMGGESAKMNLELKDGKPAMSLDIKVTGDIGESQVSGDFTKPEVINQLKQRIEGTIKEEVENTLIAAQGLQADIFGFGEIYHRKYASEWKKVEDQWEEIFSDTPIGVKVEAVIERSGYIQRPVTLR